MKQRLRKLLARALADLANHGTLPVGHDAAAIHIERARRKGHGDFASNVALTLADKASLPPRELAQAIVERLPASDFVDQVE
ncbi:MAG: arginine--tRNA ligase, partial [Acidiferrobacterales bacterium]